MTTSTCSTDASVTASVSGVSFSTLPSTTPQKLGELRLAEEFSRPTSRPNRDLGTTITKFLAYMTRHRKLRSDLMDEHFFVPMAWLCSILNRDDCILDILGRKIAFGDIIFLIESELRPYHPLLQLNSSKTHIRSIMGWTSALIGRSVLNAGWTSYTSDDGPLYYGMSMESWQRINNCKMTSIQKSGYIPLSLNPIFFSQMANEIDNYVILEVDPQKMGEQPFYLIPGCPQIERIVMVKTIPLSAIKVYQP